MAVGIVCEFNPFHNGHKYILSRAARLTRSPVVCAMSGNFVQRGEYACADKKVRAVWALENGADIVLENPFPFCCATAEKFALSAVSILLKSSLCDTIAFGIENNGYDSKRGHNADFCGKDFYDAAEILLDAKNSAEIARRVRTDKRMGYAQIRSEYISEKYGSDMAALISSPNSILGVEYAKAALVLTPAEKKLPELLPIARIGAEHDSSETVSVIDTEAEASVQNIVSASRLRNSPLPFSHELANCCPEIVSNYLFENGFLKVDEQKLYAALLQVLLFTDENELEKIAELPTEYASKMKKAAAKCQSGAEFMLSLKARHITDAKLRRMILYVLTHTKKEALSKERLPHGAMLLGNTAAGASLLRQRKAVGAETDKNNPAFPFSILSRMADIKKLPEDEAGLYKNQLAAERMFNGLLKESVNIKE